MKKLFALLLASVLVLGLFAGCDSTPSTSSSDPSSSEDDGNTVDIVGTIKVGASPTPHAEILREAEKLLLEKGYALDIVEFSDYVQPNLALDSRELDANFFQHQPYLDWFNEEYETDLLSVGAVHYEPLGLYAGKTASIDDLPDGATIAVPNDTTNEARSLLLLETLGLITLREGAGIEATQLDIVENPKNLSFYELAAEQVAHSLQDVDLAVINGNYALLGGLKVEDALAKEEKDSLAAETYGNVLTVHSEDTAREDIKLLLEVLKSEQIKAFIEQSYNGAVVPAE